MLLSLRCCITAADTTICCSENDSHIAVPASLSQSSPLAWPSARLVNVGMQGGGGGGGGKEGKGGGGEGDGGGGNGGGGEGEGGGGEGGGATCVP